MATMDPEVIAAFLGAPATVVAAAAAFAAGRAQARGAHRGPVDAVRRQHQRDAYAAFLAALHAYEAETDWDARFERARTEVLASGAPRDHLFDERVVERARELVLSVSIDDLMRTGAAVDLEGPDLVAAAAMITIGVARQVRRLARQPFSYDADIHALVEAHDKLKLAIDAFVKVARAHLNGVDG
jgi:hypothetical protein